MGRDSCLLKDREISGGGGIEESAREGGCSEEHKTHNSSLLETEYGGMKRQNKALSE